MNNLTQVILDGNLTADPETKRTPSDKTLTRFRIASNHEWGGKNGKKQVSYFSVECWERLGENCAEYLKKGSRVTIQGELREDRWQDQEGKHHSRIKIVAYSVRFDSSPVKKQKAAEAA